MSNMRPHRTLNVAPKRLTKSCKILSSCLTECNVLLTRKRCRCYVLVILTAEIHGSQFGQFNECESFRHSNRTMVFFFLLFTLAFVEKTLNLSLGKFPSCNVALKYQRVWHPCYNQFDIKQIKRISYFIHF